MVKVKCSIIFIIIYVWKAYNCRFIHSQVAVLGNGKTRKLFLWFFNLRLHKFEQLFNYLRFTWVQNNILTVIMRWNKMLLPFFSDTWCFHCCLSSYALKGCILFSVIFSFICSFVPSEITEYWLKGVSILACCQLFRDNWDKVPNL